jgi:hypothetical protein
MCPVCIAAAALIAGKVTSTGGAAAVAIRRLSGKKAVSDDSVRDPKGSENAAAKEIVLISNQRRDEYDNDRDSKCEDRVA